MTTSSRAALYRVAPTLGLTIALGLTGSIILPNYAWAEQPEADTAIEVGQPEQGSSNGVESGEAQVSPAIEETNENGNGGETVAVDANPAPETTEAEPQNPYTTTNGTSESNEKESMETANDAAANTETIIDETAEAATASVTGWRTINGNTYYYENGVAVKGEKVIGNYWYFFDYDTGIMKASGFAYIKEHNKWCYYDASGHMLYGEQVIDGEWYYLDETTGAVTYGWYYHSNQSKWVYYNTTTGRMLYGSQYIDGHWYYFDTTTGAKQDDYDGDAADEAESKIGCAYVWGATGPSTFDCSGLVVWCYSQTGHTLPSGVRTTEQMLARAQTLGKVYPVSQARKGDILYKYGHVAIAYEDGGYTYIHAPYAGANVCKATGGTSAFTYALRLA